MSSTAKTLLFVLLFSLLAVPAWATQNLGQPRTLYLDDDGDPSAMCLYTFTCGTTTNKATYPTSADAVAGTNANANPVQASSRSEFGAIYFVGCIKVALGNPDEDGNCPAYASADIEWTEDNYYGQGSSILDFATLNDNYGCDMSNLDSGTYTGGEKTIYIDCDDTLAANVSTHSDIHLIGEKGNEITLGTYDLTINGKFDAGNFQVFNENSTGVVAFGNGAIHEVNCAWYGLNGDATALDGTGTDDSSAIQSCVDSAKASTSAQVVSGASDFNFSQIGVYIPSGAYLLTSGLWAGADRPGGDDNGNALHYIRGDAGGQTTLYFKVDAHAIDLSGAFGVVIQDLDIIGDGTTKPKTGLLLARTSGGESAGTHRFVNLDIWGSYSVASVYNYASEVNSWFFCRIYNAAGYAAFIQTSNNDNASYGNVTSANTTLKTDGTAYSNFGGFFYGTRFDYRRTTSGDANMAAVILESVHYGPKFYGDYFNLGSADDCPMVRMRHATGVTSDNIGPYFVGCVFHSGATSYIVAENDVDDWRVEGCAFTGNDTNVTDAAIYATDDGTSNTSIVDAYIEAPEINFKDGRNSQNIDCLNCKIRLVESGNPGLTESFKIYRKFQGELYAESGDTVEYDADNFSGCIHETDTGIKKCWQTAEDTGTVGRVEITNDESPYSATGYEQTIYIDMTDGNVTITLPVVTHYLVGKELLIILTEDSGNTATINAGASNYFDSDYGPKVGAASSSLTITGDSTNQMESVLLRAIKNNRWLIVENNGWSPNAQTLTVADDAATSWSTSQADTGIIHVGIDDSTAYSGVILFDCGSGGASTVKIGGGASFDRTTGALVGTTGADGSVTVSAHTDGKLYIENRSGGEKTFSVRVLHAF